MNAGPFGDRTNLSHEVAETVSANGQGSITELNFLPVKPRGPAGHALVQAMLTTMQPRHVDAMASHAHAFLVDGGVDKSPGNRGGRVRLLAYYSPAETVPGESPKGLVILLHGWEGCSHSIFNLVLGSELIRHGYDVIRLNLRDHGPRVRVDPIHLNEGLFLGTLLDEVREAVLNVRALRRAGLVALVGASLGGNYALRLATLAGEEDGHTNEPLVDRAIAVSPVVAPHRSVDLIDRNRPFRNYFRTKWLASLQRKQAAFPHRYDFRGLERLSRIRPMTEWLVRRYSDFGSADEYLEGYAFLGDDSLNLRTATTLLAAEDDPVIPVEEINSLADSPWLNRYILPWGGHAGLIGWPPLRHHMPQLILRILSDTP